MSSVPRTYAVICCLGLLASTNASETYFLTADQPLTLLSINDGEVAPWWEPDTEPTPDSITVIDVFTDEPPRSRTVYGTTQSSYWGTPRSAIIGRFGVVTNHTMNRSESELQSGAVGDNQLVVLDMKSDGLIVTDRLELDFEPFLALAHPDEQRLLVAGKNQWRVYEMDAQGKLDELRRTDIEGLVYSFTLGSDGKTIIGAVETVGSGSAIWQFALEEDNSIRTVREFSSDRFVIDGPFSPRTTPDGRLALVPNGFGESDGILDDVLVLDLETGTVSGRVTQVADGLESVAIHPSGRYAVIACLNEYGSSDHSQLAVIDLDGETPRLLYYLPIEHIPEGIEFSSDGSLLFVGTTLANQIVVYRVEGKNLVRHPAVLATGYGPIALAISG